MSLLDKSIAELIEELEKRVKDKVIEKSNAELLKKLIQNANSTTEAIDIATLGTTYKRTGLHFDKRLEKLEDTIKYLKRNDALSFKTKDGEICHELIVGDNYDALLNLVIKYKNSINIIYIDPPYGKDSMGNFAETNYQNAITRDNLLSMMYPRLVLAKRLLSVDDGVIFCSVDYKNQAYMKLLFDEIFGENNFICNLFILDNLKGKSNDNLISTVGHYVLVYARNKERLVFNGGFNQTENSFGKRVLEKYNQSDETGLYELVAFRKSGQEHLREDRPTMYYPILMKDDKLCAIEDGEYAKIYVNGTFNDEYVEKLRKKYEYAGYTFILPINEKNEKARWTCAFESGFKTKLNNGDIIYKSKTIYEKKRPSGREIMQEFADSVAKQLFYKPSYANGTQDLENVVGENKFDYPKPVSLIKDLIMLLPNNKEATILDFFAGSGTTGQAVLELNKKDNGKRKFILCTSNEITDETPNGVVSDVTSKRLKRLMTGKCYDGSTNFNLAKQNLLPLGGNLDVYEIDTVSNLENNVGKTPFDVIDETIYGKAKFSSIKDKIEWVCSNFENAQSVVEKDAEWLNRVWRKSDAEGSN